MLTRFNSMPILRSVTSHVSALSTSSSSLTNRITSPILKAATAHAEATFDSRNGRSFEQNWARLHGSVAKELEGLYNDKSDKTSAKDKYEAGEMLRWIQSLDDFAKMYDIQRGAGGGVKTFKDFLTSQHKEFLMKELHSRITDSPEDKNGKPLIAQMARHGALKEFGIEHSPRRHGGSPVLRPGMYHANLDLDQLLAITDYTHPHTGTFNAIIPAGRMAQFGQTKFKQAIAPLHGPLTSGFEQLSRDPQFGVSGDFYKGLNLTANKWAEEGMWNQTWKDRFREGQDKYSFGHPISVVDSVENSYADRPGYDHLAKFSGFRAADVSVFNVGELIIPEGLTVGAKISGFSHTQVRERERERGGEKSVDIVEFKRGALS